MLFVKQEYRTLALLFVAGCLFGIGIFASMQTLVPSLRHEAAIRSCTGLEHHDQKVECVFEIIRDEMVTSGVGAGMEVLARAYELIPTFATTGCHLYSHRTGDVAYYQLYVGTENLEAIDFPQSTTACGYGFYHGFLEHLTQDDPTADTITRTCEYFRKRLGADLRDIAPICYHGAGHGLMLAQAERLSRVQWGNTVAFVKGPAATCASLSEASTGEIEQCEDGLFTMLVQWMVEEENGFAMDWENPLTACRALPQNLLRACYAEVSQKLAQVTDNTPAVAVELVKTIPASYRLNAFSTGVAGMVQFQLNMGKGYEEALARCLIVESSYIAPCIQSVVGGLFEHGSPQQEYVKTLELCADSRIAQGGLAGFCYDRVATILGRFYEPNHRKQICGEFPPAYRESCLSLIAQRS